MKITPVFFGDRLLLQVFLLVDTTNFWSLISLHFKPMRLISMNYSV